MHARGIEHHTPRRAELPGRDQHRPGLGPHRPAEGCGYATITGQGNGQGGREHGQKCDQLPGGRDIENPEHRAHVAGVWGIDAEELPARRRRCLRDVPQDRRAARSRGLLSASASTRRCRCRTATSSRGCSSKLEFYVAIDFFLSETARHADIVLPGSLHEEDEGTVTQAEGRVIKINKAVDCPGDARQDWRIIQDIARALGRERGFTFAESARDLRGTARAPRRAASPTTPASPTRRSRANYGVFWPCPDRGPSRHAAAVRAGLVEPDRARATGRSTSPTARPASTSPPTRRRPRTWMRSIPIILTTGRVVSQFLSGTQTRRIGPLVDQYPEPRIEMHPRLAEQARHRRRRLGDRSNRAAARCTLRAQVVTTIRPDTVFVPYHWAGRQEHQPGDDRRPGSDLEDPGIQGVRGAASRKADGAAASTHGQLRTATVKPSARQSPMPDAGRPCEFFIDPSRCIGCQACVQACSECDTHKGHR